MLINLIPEMDEKEPRQKKTISMVMTTMFK